MRNLFKAAAVFAIWWFSKDYINTWEQNLRFLAHLFGIGLPICLLLEPAFGFLRAFFKIRINIMRRVLGEKMDNLFQFKKSKKVYTNPLQDAPIAEHQEVPQPNSLLNSAQIEKLNELRSKIVITDAKQFPQIRLSGANMPNLVPGAGMFTAKIKRNGEIQNLVVMLATLNAVYEFEKLFYSAGCQTQDFWAEGYLLPSQTGICYSVLFVTSFRFNGRRITF